MRYLFFALVLLAACSDPDTKSDAGQPVITDSGTPPDSGMPPPDGGIPIDSGVLSNLDRPGLSRPPTNGLPAELRPPR